jgi:hypothetical protein
MNRDRLLVLGLISVLTASALGAGALDTLRQGKVELKSASALAFGPQGILFVGDSTAAVIWAIDTSDHQEGSSAAINLSGIDAKLAGLLGSSKDQVLINDLAVNPLSHKAYLSVSRGRGPGAQPILFRVDAAGKISELKLDDVRHSKVSLSNAPDPEAKNRRGRSLRQEAITDLAFVDGQVIVAGLSNEEFASNLRSLDFPFSSAGAGTSVEIFHGAHGKYETNSPVRTFVPFEIMTEPHILAAYTCTPLVKFPLADLTPGTKVVGTTIAELGNRNRPLDMVLYNKSGKDYVLMSNSSRGVMKLSTEHLDSFGGITAKTGITGVPYETIAELQGVKQLDRLDAANALLLVQTEAGSVDLKTVAFP